MRLIRRIFFAAVLGIAALRGALWLEHWIPVTLPVPTGHREVIRYLPARFLSDAVNHSRLCASERAGFTWGDAIYVAPRKDRPIKS